MDSGGIKSIFPSGYRSTSSLFRLLFSRFQTPKSNHGKTDVDTEVAAAGQSSKRTFKKFSFRGVGLDSLLDMSADEFVKLLNARSRIRFQRDLKRKPMALIKKLRKFTPLQVGLELLLKMQETLFIPRIEVEI